MKKLKDKEAKQHLKELKESVIREECWSCECFQGFLSQLEMDSSEDISELIKPLKVSSPEMHNCLGCQPCPPGNLFSEYRCCKTCK